MSLTVLDVLASEIDTSCEWIRLETDVKSLKASIEEVGLLQPRVVDEHYKLLCGGRRYTVMSQLGWKKMPCLMYKLDEVKAEMAAIDDNIKRTDFKGAQLAKALKRRKELYLILHPEKKRGGDIKSPKAKSNAQNALPVPTFAEDTAEQTGVGRHTIDRQIHRAEHASPEVMEAWENDDLSPSQVDALTYTDHETQEKLLPYAADRTCDDIKDLVDDAKLNGVDSTISGIRQIDEAQKIFKKILKGAKSLTVTIQTALGAGYSYEAYSKIEIQGELIMLQESMSQLLERK